MKNIRMQRDTYYTEPLHFVLIHLETTNTASALPEKTHVHAIKQQALIPTRREKSGATIPPHTIIQYGSFDAMRNGYFDSGINERFRAHNIAGHYGLASRSIKHDQQYLLNDEAMIYDNISYYGGINGKAQPFDEDDVFAFLQVFSLENALSLHIPSSHSMTEFVQTMKNNKELSASFAAVFTGIMLKNTSQSRVISAVNTQTNEYSYTLQDVWDNKRLTSGREQPDLAHIEGINGDDILECPGLILLDPVAVTPIYNIENMSDVITRQK